MTSCCLLAWLRCQELTALLCAQNEQPAAEHQQLAPSAVALSVGSALEAQGSILAGMRLPPADTAAEAARQLLAAVTLAEADVRQCIQAAGPARYRPSAGAFTALARFTAAIRAAKDYGL